MAKERRAVQVGDVYVERDTRTQPQRRVEVVYVGVAGKRADVKRLNGPKAGTQTPMLLVSLQTRWTLVTA